MQNEPIVTTPASQPGGPPTVAVFGAGIAGLTAAHELAERGFKVTVYEAAPDSRADLDDEPTRNKQKEVRLGGMAATQYVDGARLQRYPDSAGAPKQPAVAATGEHGFRFFPAYYLHIWDTLRRIPIYENGNATARTVYDNVQRVIAQAGTAPKGQPSLVIPREAPRSISELIGSYQEMLQLGYTPNDLSTFFGRIARYLATSSQRRADELEEISTYDYLVGTDADTDGERFQYSPAFTDQLQNMPRILAAFDARRGDARTNMSTYVQLNMSLDRYDSKADGVLDAPTTEAWFDPWHDHLNKLGVEFKQATLRSFTLVDVDEDGRKKVKAQVIDATNELSADAEIRAEELTNEHLAERRRAADLDDFDYYIVATDAFRAELATAGLRHQQYTENRSLDPTLLTDLKPENSNARQRLRSLSTVLGLDGFATTAPPADGPLGPPTAVRRNPLLVDTLGQTDWDRFQTLSGIQFFFDTEFQVLLGHVYYSKSDWGLSSINSTGLWIDKPRLDPNGYVSIMSVDIGDWRKQRQADPPCSAYTCTRNELAREVWRQVSTELGPSLGERVESLQLPTPSWYSIDTFIEYGTDEHNENEHPVRNEAPYLIPIVGDWKNRPGAYPWNPSGSSPTWLPQPDTRQQQLGLGVWQAGHGGYQVHFDKLVFAGTWCKTFTRMTSMEAASESGRHAVNAILDHYLFERSGRTDSRPENPPAWRMPYGFVDQELSSPIRFPTPAGDYCFIYDCENREPGDARPTRLIDADYWMQGLPHPWTLSGIDQAAVAASNAGSSGVTANLFDPTWVLEQLRQWRRVVEMVFGPADAQGAKPKGEPPKPGGTRSPYNAGLFCLSGTTPPGSASSPKEWYVAGPSISLLTPPPGPPGPPGP